MIDGSPFGAVDPGEPVYEDGWRLGRVAGSTNESFEVETATPTTRRRRRNSTLGRRVRREGQENWRVRVNTPRSGSATVSEKQLKTFALAVLSNPERGRYI